MKQTRNTSPAGMRSYSLAIGLVLAIALARPAGAVNFTVNSTLDLVDPSIDGTCDAAPPNGVCTLRAAIQEANAAAGPDQIYVPVVGTIKLTRAGTGEDAAATGDLDIIDTVTIDGDGPNTTIIDGNKLDRVFHITAGDLSISGMTIRKGSEPSGLGGCIYNAGAGKLTLLTATIEKCEATEGGGIFSNGDVYTSLANIRKSVASGRGGGILVQGPPATSLEVHASIIEKNKTDVGGDGGGVFAGDIDTTIENSIIRSNVTPAEGGGIWSSGSLELQNVVIERNKSDGNFGGGILAVDTVDIEDSIIAKNKAAGGAGLVVGGPGSSSIVRSAVLSNNADDDGGGIWVQGGTLTLESVTIAKNKAGIQGGGIRNQGTCTMKNVSLVDNVAPAASAIHSTGDVATDVYNTIVLGKNNCDVAVDSSTNNLESQNSCGFAGAGNLPNTDPLVGKRTPFLPISLPLFYADPPAYPLTLGSPAIDAGDNGTCTADDQRNDPRPTDGDGDGTATCDIGAYEVNGP